MDPQQARLRYLQLKAKAQPAQPNAAADAGKAFLSQAGRNIPEGLDLGGAIAATGIDALTGGNGDYFEGFLQPRQTPMSDLTDAVVGEKYEPKTGMGTAGQIAGGFVGLSSAPSAFRNFVGAIKGMGGSLDNFISDPEALKTLYRAWKDNLENVPVSSKELRRDLVNPAMEKIGADAKFATSEGKDKLDQLLELGTDDGTLGDVYALRKSLGNLKDSSVAQPIRDTSKEFMESRAGVEGLDAYRRASTYEDVQHALRNVDNEGIKATRTKINNLDETGMSAAEKAAKQAAGRGSMGENLLREVGNKTLAASVAFGPMGFLLGQGGKALSKGADSMANARIEALQQVLLNGREAPNMGERAGAALRNILQGKR